MYAWEWCEPERKCNAMQRRSSTSHATSRQNGPSGRNALTYAIRNTDYITPVGRSKCWMRVLLLQHVLMMIWQT